MKRGCCLVCLLSADSVRGQQAPAPR